MKMLALLQTKTRILNVDETWIDSTNYTHQMWCPSYGAGTIANHAVSPRLSMIAALDTEGKVYFSLSHATTDSDAMMTFI